MTKLKITVTKEILEKSKNCLPGNSMPTNCAIALAIRDIFPNASVGTQTISFNTKAGDGVFVYTPPIATRFIGQFDIRSAKERVMLNPISFEIEVPESVIESINIDELKPLLENHPTLQLL